MATIRQLLHGTPKYATAERREVPRGWILCSHCGRLLKTGHQATYYTPNKVYRCDDCARRAPAVQTYDDAGPGECQNCFQRVPDLPVTVTVNGQDIDVCAGCARGAELVDGATTRPAAKRTLF